MVWRWSTDSTGVTKTTENTSSSRFFSPQIIDLYGRSSSHASHDNVNIKYKYYFQLYCHKSSSLCQLKRIKTHISTSIHCTKIKLKQTRSKPRDLVHELECSHQWSGRPSIMLSRGQQGSAVRGTNSFDGHFELCPCLVYTEGWDSWLILQPTTKGYWWCFNFNVRELPCPYVQLLCMWNQIFALIRSSKFLICKWSGFLLLTERRHILKRNIK